MKTTFCVLVSFFLLFVYSCTNEMNDLPVVSQNEKNIAAIQAMAAEYGCNGVSIEYSQERTTPLTDEEFQYYRGYFETLKNTKNIPVVFEQPTSTRSLYYGTVGGGFKVTVYWDEMRELSPDNVVAGVGGNIRESYWSNVLYTLTSFDKTVLDIRDGVIKLFIRADYRTEYYYMLNGTFNTMPYYRLTNKAYVRGYVDTRAMVGYFDLEIVEKGSFYEEAI